MSNITKIVCCAILGIAIALVVVSIVPALSNLEVLAFLAISAMALFLILIWLINNEQFVSFFILSLPLIPLFQALLPRNVQNDLGIEVFLLEMLLGGVLSILWLTKRNIGFSTTKYQKDFEAFKAIISIWVGLNLLPTVFSMDTYRSLMLFLIGVLEPVLVFFLIANKTRVSHKMLLFLLLSLIGSGMILILLGFAFKFVAAARTGVDILLLREGDIYGSNAVIGAIAFILPLVFMGSGHWRGYWPQSAFNIFRAVFLLFTLLSIIWIITALSRWGYVTFATAFALVLFFDRGYPKLRWTILLTAALLLFIMFFSFSEHIREVITYRFTYGQPLSWEYILQVAREDARWDIWQNAWDYFKDNIVVGVGLGNHFAISPQQFTTAHNIFLNILVERGILVSIAFGAIIAFFYRLNFKFRRKAKDQNLRRLSLFLGIGMMTFLVWALTGGDFIQARGFISAIPAHYFSVILGLQLYIIKLDCLNIETGYGEKGDKSDGGNKNSVCIKP